MTKSDRSTTTIIILTMIIVVVVGVGIAFLTGAFTQSGANNKQVSTPGNKSTSIEETEHSTDIVRTPSVTSTVTLVTRTTATKTDRKNTIEDQPFTVNSTTSHTPQSTKTHTVSPTKTATPTTEPGENETNDKYLPFIYSFAGTLKASTDVPMRIMGVLVDDKTMWVVHDGTSPFVNDTRMRQEWQEIATAYVAAWKDYRDNNLSGAGPKRLRYVEFNDSEETANDSTFFIPTSDVRAVLEGNMSVGEFNSRWFRRLRDTTAFEESQANDIANSTINVTYYPDGWNKSNNKINEANSIPDIGRDLDRGRNHRNIPKAREGSN